MNDLNSIDVNAKRIAKELDKLDGEDGTIKANTWNNIFNAKEKGGKEIRLQISLFNAEKSIKTYLKRNSETKEAQNDLTNKWLNSLTQKPEVDSAQKGEPVQKEEPALEGKVEEVVITGTRQKSMPLISFDDMRLPELETNINITTPAVSTYVAPVQPPEIIREATNLAKIFPEGTVPLIKHEMSQTIANEWATVFNIDNSDNSFTQFVDELYEVIEELNISNLTFEHDKAKYTKKEDQIVDELCRMFANESQFNSKAANGNQIGIFQFTPIGLKDLLDKTVNGIDLFNFNDLKFANGETVVTKEMYKNMSQSERHSFCTRYLKNNFSKLSRIEQLKYFTKHIQNCKTNYSRLNDKPVSVAQVYSMNWYPADGNLQSRIDNRKSVMRKRTNERIAICNRKMASQQPIKS